MTIMHFHTPKGIIAINSESFTDEELAEVGITRKNFEKALPKAAIPFTPPVFDPPGTGIPERMAYIEKYLKECYEHVSNQG